MSDTNADEEQLLVRMLNQGCRVINVFDTHKVSFSWISAIIAQVGSI